MRRLAYQAAAVAVALIVVGYLVHNASVNLAERRIASGFGFLEREAGFEISESPFLRYSASDTYLSALAVGVGNTLRVAFIGIVAATLLGAAVGLFRLSKNFLLRTLAAAYVEFIRNSPLLVQLFFWYAVITEALPMPREALQPLPGVFLTNRGIYFPAPGSVPVLESFNFAGGFVLTPEFTALLLGLTVYTAAFIAEIVRGGIQAISHGQTEAAHALGLSGTQTTRLVILPQALRVIIPPLTNQYLNLTKNSSLAVAIGYPDLVQIFAGTALNQSAKAIEIMLMTMAVYLSLSLITSVVMNIYNRRMAFVER